MTAFNPNSLDPIVEDSIAVIGMSCRFPGASEIHEFWELICEGREMIRDLSHQDLLDAGASEEAIQSDNYVSRAAWLEDSLAFDAAFFGISPREAELMDPQQRIFLECAWRALESAGYIPDKITIPTGVFAGSSISTYLTHHLLNHPKAHDILQDMRVRTGNDKDFMATRISYLLNLRGPAMSINTACSTSLVAVHQACNSLQLHECDMALAGGVSLKWNQKYGYTYQQDGIASLDGRCRTFDAEASGTIGGNGAGIVVLKRLKDALNDGDDIHAIVRGRGINNDGKNKVSYISPSVHGQKNAILEAMMSAEISSDSIGYIETHGTGTQLGDPIEIEALKLAFGSQYTQGSCALGSIKPNIGHLDAAAGIAGFIKAVLVVKNGKIPPLTHFQTPNPELGLESSPFFIPQQLSAWPKNEMRRAGVSSFGIGGTNIHLILEESPIDPIQNIKKDSKKSCYVFPFSARQPEGVRRMMKTTADYLKTQKDIDIARLVATLSLSRKRFPHRVGLVASSLEELLLLLEQSSKTSVHQGFNKSNVVFVFQGQNQFATGTTRQLYETEPEFRRIMDQCIQYCAEAAGMDIRSILYETDSNVTLKDVGILQPVKLAIEISLAHWLMSKGVQPKAVVGHSLGEYAAAYLAGVMDLSTAMHIISKRGSIITKAPDGGMTAVYIDAATTERFLHKAKSAATISAFNSPTLTVISGSKEELSKAESLLEKEQISFKRLGAQGAYHSDFMRSLRVEFLNILSSRSLQAPRLPLISNVTGTWISNEMAANPNYWADHMEKPVRFTEGILEIAQSVEEPIFIELGIGHSLSNLIRQIIPEKAPQALSLFAQNEEMDEQKTIWNGLAGLWARGVEPDWSALHISREIPSIHLPGYAFAREEFVFKLPKNATNKPAPKIGLRFYTKDLKSVGRPVKRESLEGKESILVLGFDPALLHSVGQEFDVRGTKTTVSEWENFLGNMEAEIEKEPSSIILVISETSFRDANEMWDNFQKVGKRLQQESVEKNKTMAFSLVMLSGEKGSATDKSDIGFFEQMIGSVTVWMQESAPKIRARFIHIKAHEADSDIVLAKWIVEECETFAEYAVVREGKRRFVPVYQEIEAPTQKSATVPMLLRNKGRYLITGGLGNVGKTISRYLSNKGAEEIIFLSRRTFPNKEKWAVLSKTETKDPHRDLYDHLCRLESYGTSVHVVQGDVSDRKSLFDVLHTIETQFGTINGLIHAAGITSGSSIGVAWDELSSKELALQAGPKIFGTSHLIDYFKKKNLDVCLLISSNASELGGLGLAAYMAVSRGMDRLAQQWFDKLAFPIISSNWDGWPTSAEGGGGPETDLERLALTEEDAFSSLDFIFNQNTLPQIIISKETYDIRSERWHYPYREEIQVSEKEFISAASMEKNRPSLSTAYEAPVGDVEHHLVEIWQDMLGIFPIGVYDNFFELRGDSLLATQMLTRFRNETGHKISLKTLFLSLTIRGLSEWLETNVETVSSQTEGDEMQGTGEPELESSWEEGEL